MYKTFILLQYVLGKILVRVVVDLEPIPGKLGVREEYTLGMGI